jgi:hypothetical protein
MKTTVEIADPLFKRIRTLAVEEGTTMSELVEEGLRLVVEQRTQRAPFTLRNAHVEGRGVQPGVDEGDWVVLRGLIYEGRGG